MSKYYVNDQFDLYGQYATCIVQYAVYEAYYIPVQYFAAHLPLHLVVANMTRTPVRARAIWSPPHV